MASIKWLNRRKRWIIRWHVTIRQGQMIGRVIKGSKTFRQKEAALYFKAEIERKADYWAAGLGKAPELIRVAVERWYRTIRDLTPRTQYLYKLVLPKFVVSLPSNVGTVSQINAIHIRNYLNGLQDKGRSKRTCNVHLTIIKAFSRFLAEHYGIPNPAGRVKMLKEDPPTQRFLDTDEYEKVLSVAHPAESRIVQFLANTGLRATEFAELTWKCVDPAMTAIAILGKNRKRRSVPLNETCKQILSAVKPNGPNKSRFIFLSKSEKPFSRFLLRSKCLQLAKRAKIDRFGPHSLRHFFATELLTKGVSLEIVSKLLGHSSIRVTEQTYIHILPKHLKGTTDCLT